jgi:hypothetical protein
VVSIRDVQVPPPAPLVALPGGSDAWVLQVTTSGGITGTGARSANFAVSSEGRIACAASECSNRALPPELKRLTGMLTGLDPSVWPEAPLVAEPSLCSDCLRTTLTYWKRDGDFVAVRTTSWDPTQPVAAPIRELANALTTIATPR